MSTARAEMTVLLIGVGGYGHTYVEALLAHGAARGLRIVGVADPYAAASGRHADLVALGVPIVDRVEAFYDHGAADLAVVSSPIPCHVPQSLVAVAHGSAVLCEKPVSATWAEALRLWSAGRDAGRDVAIGYQWSYAPGTQALKADIMAGRLGAPRRLMCWVSWPRGRSYYARNAWAGRRRLPDGTPVNDSPANNATAHYLHHMFYLLGPTRTSSAWPLRIEAETYRAKPIENFDTLALRCRVSAGCEAFFLTTHAAARQEGPILRFEFDEATVQYAPGGGGATATYRDGHTRHYDDFNVDHLDKLWQVADALRGGSPAACPLPAAMPQTLAIDTVQRILPECAVFPETMLGVTGDAGDPVDVAEGLDADLRRCFEAAALPSELGFAWAVPAASADCDKAP